MLSVKKIAEIFGGVHLKQSIDQLVANKTIEPPKKFRSGAIFKKGWDVSELPSIGKEIGFLKTQNLNIYDFHSECY